MKTVAAIATMGAAAASAMSYLDSDVQLFREFKLKHNKSYMSDEHEMEKFITFKKNVAYINSHNLKSDEHGFTLGINQFADMTNSEYRSMLSNSGPLPRTEDMDYAPELSFQEDDSVDWRDKGYVNPIKDQGQCGSCWAFSAVASLEGQHFKKYGKLLSLSEQQLVDCSSSFGNHGCSGGLMNQVFSYIKSVSKNGGLDLESEYTYTATDDRGCKAKPGSATVTGYTSILPFEAQLTKNVAAVGPISVAIDASQMSFQFYKSGVYFEPNCSSRRLDHGVAVVGYGVQDDADKLEYYLVRNSWNTSWGEEGYIKMSRGRSNNCGIATQASYPHV